MSDERRPTYLEVGASGMVGWNNRRGVADAESGALGYVATFEVMPEITLSDLSGAVIKRPTATVEESDVDAMIESLRRQRTNWVEVDRPARDGDTLQVSFKGTVDGEAFPGGSADHVPLTLGSGSMIPGFESGLVGAAKGEARNLAVSFPADYRVASLAGSSVWMRQNAIWQAIVVVTLDPAGEGGSRQALAYAGCDLGHGHGGVE